MKPVSITYSPEELRHYVWLLGLDRAAAHMEKKVGVVYGSGLNPGHYVNGLMCEHTFWRFVGLNDPFDSTVGEFNDWDVVPGVQVRCTDRPSGRLILHDADPDEYIGVLVRFHRTPTIDLIGWCNVGEGKLHCDPAPHPDRDAYFVKNEFLKGMDTLDVRSLRSVYERYKSGKVGAHPGSLGPARIRAGGYPLRVA